jgi:hypothetical protein
MLYIQRYGLNSHKQPGREKPGFFVSIVERLSNESRTGKKEKEKKKK